MAGTREKTDQGKKTERKRTTAGRREVAPPWSIAISDQPPGRWWQGDEEETEDDDPDWLTKLSEIQEKCAGCCFLAQQVLKIQTELERELARKQYKGKVNTVVATPTLLQGTTAHWGFMVDFGTTPTVLVSATTRRNGLVVRNRLDPGHFFLQAWLLI